jgi:hypothetical protein
MARRNADVAAGRWIQFRIGINLGDVIVEDDDIFGDGVNLAARLEALAEPGGICVSGAVRDQIGDRLGIKSPSTISANRDSRTSPGGSGSTASGRRGDHGIAGHAPSNIAGRSGQEAVDRGLAVPQHQRRPGAGVLCRRY